jgi:hypothetical protein
MPWPAILAPGGKGRALQFPVPVQFSTAVLRSPGKRKTPRSRQRRSSAANTARAWPIQEA